MQIIGVIRTSIQLSPTLQPLSRLLYNVKCVYSLTVSLVVDCRLFAALWVLILLGFMQVMINCHSIKCMSAAYVQPKANLDQMLIVKLHRLRHILGIPGLTGAISEEPGGLTETKSSSGGSGRRIAVATVAVVAITTGVCASVVLWT